MMDEAQGRIGLGALPSLLGHPNWQFVVPRNFRTGLSLQQLSAVSVQQARATVTCLASISAKEL